MIDLKYFIFTQTSNICWRNKRMPVKGEEKFEGPNSREVGDVNSKLCGLALMPVNQRLSH